MLAREKIGWTTKWSGNRIQFFFFFRLKSRENPSVVLPLLLCLYRVYEGRGHVRIGEGVSCRGWSHPVNNTSLIKNLILYTICMFTRFFLITLVSNVWVTSRKHYFVMFTSTSESRWVETKVKGRRRGFISDKT